MPSPARRPWSRRWPRATLWPGPWTTTLRTGEVEKIVTLPGYEVVDQPFNLDDYADAAAGDARAALAERRGNFREVELGLDERAAQEECKRCLRCDLEWLEEQGLAFEPVPEHQIVEVA
jgi:hypothetical protein